MSQRIIQITLSAERKKTIQQIAHRYEALDIWWGAKNEDGFRTMSILVDRDNQQDILDSIQVHLKDDDNWHAVLLPVEANLPRKDIEEKKKSQKFRWRKSLTREELYQEVSRGADADPIFYLMVFLATIVASIGLMNDNVAIVIAAMVIAPLLGPNLALAFGTALGDKVMIQKALICSFSGLIVSVLPSIALGFYLPENIQSVELLSRTQIDFSSIVLALASGAAAVLSITTGVSSALVGVMVSVAILPPAAAFGIFVGMGEVQNAWNSSLLLMTNLICVGLSAQIVLAFMGVRPRTFIEKRAANQSSLLQAAICLFLLVIVSVIIYQAKFQ